MSKAAHYHVDARHLKAPDYRLAGILDGLHLYDSRSQQFLLPMSARNPAALLT